MNNLVQLDEDFNSRKTSSENSWKTVGKHRKTAENIEKHLKSSDIIPRTTEHPSALIDNLVQFEEDFNNRTEKWRWGWLSQTRPIPRSPDGDKKSKYKQLE